METPDESSPFRCSICFDNKEGRQPRALPCLHSFCTVCLSQWHEECHREEHCDETQVECPTCRAKSELPSGDVSSLPLDINVQQFADYCTRDPKSNSCRLCVNKEGKVACLMCSVILCQDCSDEHKRSPLFTSHVLTENICEYHGAPLQCVCTSCLCGVCVHCVKDGPHKYHCLEETSAGIPIIKEELRELTGELKDIMILGNLKATENRKHIEEFQLIKDMKTTVYRIKKEFERLEKELAEHERLCKSKMDAAFNEYEAQCKRASAAIFNGAEILDEEDNAKVLNKLRTTELPSEQMCSQLGTSVSLMPDFDSISPSYCRIENADKALEELINCKVLCGIPDVITTTCPLVHTMKMNCGGGSVIRRPFRLSGTPLPLESAIVFNEKGGAVCEVEKDGTKSRLFNNGIAGCVHGTDLYVISNKGGIVNQRRWNGPFLQHKLIPPISDPRGLAVSGDNIFVVTSSAIIKQSLQDATCRETLIVEGCEDLGHILQISDGGMSKLVVTDRDTHEVVIIDEDGSVLTRFGGFGGEEGLLGCPGGISRMNNGHLLVADCWNHRIVEYKMDGTFVRNILTNDGLCNPRDVLYKYPDLWVADSEGLRLFKFSH